MIQFCRDLFVRDFWLKLFSLALAVVIWGIVSPAAYKDSPKEPTPGEQVVERPYFNVPVLVVSSATDVRDVRVRPDFVQVTLRGDPKALDKVQISGIRPLVDLTGIESGRRKRIEVSTPPGIAFVSVVPEEVEVVVPPRRADR